MALRKSRIMRKMTKSLKIWAKSLFSLFLSTANPKPNMANQKFQPTCTESLLLENPPVRTGTASQKKNRSSLDFRFPDRNPKMKTIGFAYSNRILASFSSENIDLYLPESLEQRYGRKAPLRITHNCLQNESDLKILRHHISSVVDLSKRFLTVLWQLFEHRRQYHMLK